LSDGAAFRIAKGFDNIARATHHFSGVC
jgi:hypothetical protein